MQNSNSNSSDIWKRLDSEDIDWGQSSEKDGATQFDFRRFSNNRQNVPLELKIESLKNSIISKIESNERLLEDLPESTSPDKNEKIFILSGDTQVYKELLKLPINNAFDYDYVSFLFNNGYLRFEEEIDAKNYEIQQFQHKKIRESAAYQKHYHPVLCYLGWFFGTPFFANAFFDGTGSAGLLGYIINSVMLWALGFIPFAIIAAIATFVYCKKHSADFGVPLDPAITNTIVGATVAEITSYAVASKVAKHKGTRIKEV